jgi:beta-glucosidase-like glycosyl hydrolase
MHMTESPPDTLSTRLSGDYRAKAAAVLAAGADLVLHCDNAVGPSHERVEKALQAEFGHYFEAVA